MTCLLTIRKAMASAVFGAFCVFALVAQPTAAKAECGAFPRVQLWQDLNHDFVRKLVAKRYHGDWDAYLGKLERYHDKLAAIHEQGLRAGVTWRGKKVKLRGKKLADFLVLVDRRVAVTKCLAAADTVADFSTAAGGDMQAVGSEARDPMTCGAIPDVEWWVLKTPDEIITYVQRRNNGDFPGYVAKWEDRLRNLQDIYARGSTAITSTGQMLRGPALHHYMTQMRQRNNVVRCLASIYAGTRS